MSEQLKFGSLYTAVITPFKKDKIDFPGFNKILEYQDRKWIDGIVVAGSTGEGASLNILEKESLFNFSRSYFKNRKKIIANISSFCFTTTLEEARIAKKAGIDAILLTPPLYMKTTKEGIKNFYKAIIENTGLPIIIYNVPSRVGYNIDRKILEELCKVEKIVGIKECSGDFSYVSWIRKYTNLKIFCGDDRLYLQYLVSGADGIISVVSNILPEFVYAISLYVFKNLKRAIRLFYDSFDFLGTLFEEPNPVGIKVLMAEYNFCSNILRPPLEQPPASAKKKILNCFKNFYHYLKENKIIENKNDSIISF